MSIQIRNKDSEYPLSRLSAQIVPIDQSKAIAVAAEALGVVTRARLKLILSQIEHLQNEAQGIIDTANENMAIHMASCTFNKSPGQIYHLYCRGPLDTDRYLSMLSPEEWGTPPHKYLGSYLLEEDMTWTRTSYSPDSW